MPPGKKKSCVTVTPPPATSPAMPRLLTLLILLSALLSAAASAFSPAAVRAADHGFITHRTTTALYRSFASDAIGNRMASGGGNQPHTSYTASATNAYRTLFADANANGTPDTGETETLKYGLDGNLIEDAAKIYAWKAPQETGHLAVRRDFRPEIGGRYSGAFLWRSPAGDVR